MLDKVDILELLQAVLKRWWVLLLCALVFGGATYGYSKYFQEREYVSVGRMFIDTNRADDSEDSERSSAVITASQKSVLTCIEVIKSIYVMEKVAESSGLVDEDGKYLYSASNIRNRTALTAANETEVLQIKVTTNNPEHAKILVDSIMTVAETELKDIVGVSTAKIIDEGTQSNSPVSPNVRRQSMVGFIVGMLIGALIVVAIRLMDIRIKSEEDLSKFNAPIIGVIPEID